MASAEQLLELYDSYWFEYGIFASNPNPFLSGLSKSSLQTYKLNRIPTLMVRSFSDQALGSKNNFHTENKTECSPKSVLVPKLQTILSGKEVEEFSETEPRIKEHVEIAIKEKQDFEKKTRTKTRRRKKGNSKSLSELEFEELKGFMDLGFVFSDEDKDSRLVSIIPGLQRLGKKQGFYGEDAEKNRGKYFDDDGDDDNNNKDCVSRPYLSEAWEDFEKRRRFQDPLMNWRIPAFGNEMELKDHLRFWAHTVASTVR